MYVYNIYIYMHVDMYICIYVSIFPTLRFDHIFLYHLYLFVSARISLNCCFHKNSRHKSSGQHTKTGFTSLLCALAALSRPSIVFIINSFDLFLTRCRHCILRRRVHHVACRRYTRTHISC